jgi:predicted nucleic acid-binding protein
MPTGKTTVYWDTSVFLAWIKNEKRPNGEMDGVNYFAEKIAKNEIILLTSTLINVEILESTLNDEAKDRFHNLFKRRNCVQVDADGRIMQLASKIRDYYQNQKSIDRNKTLSTPDSIHLATAIQYSVTEFHTFDENDDPGRKWRGLTPLSGTVAGEYPLKICKPSMPPLPLFSKYKRNINLRDEE